MGEIKSVLYGDTLMLAPVSIISGTVLALMGVLASWYVASNAASSINFFLLLTGIVFAIGEYVVGMRGTVSKV
jgi:hypothetical protein